MRCDVCQIRRAKYEVSRVPETDCPCCADQPNTVEHLCGTCLHYDNTCCRMVAKIGDDE